MKINSIRGLLLAFSIAFSLSASGQSVKLMTYNLRLDVASDGLDAWPNRRDFVVGLIKFHAPDIFGTQEGLPHQIEFLQKTACFIPTKIGFLLKTLLKLFSSVGYLNRPLQHFFEQNAIFG